MAIEKWLIDANKLIDDIKTFKGLGAIMADTLVRFVKKQPTVDAMEVVHGEWEYGKWDQGHWVQGNERCRCSVCHRDFAVDNANIWHGCPHCLAKMDGGNTDGQRINL